MKISSLSIPKYRDLHAGGDDTTLILPGLLAVFDGASSPVTGAGGESTGKAASVAAANTVAGMVLEGSFMDAEAGEICDRIRIAIAEAQRRFPEGAHPATTMSAVAFGAGKLRILSVGDSGVRINGSEVYRHLKPIDDIWTMGRVLCFKALSRRHTDMDAVEAMARRCAFQGLDRARAENVLTEAEAKAIHAETLAAHAAAVLARYKQPRLYRQVADLPRNRNGKIDRRAIRAGWPPETP